MTVTFPSAVERGQLDQSRRETHATQRTETLNALGDGAITSAIPRIREEPALAPVLTSIGIGIAAAVGTAVALWPDLKYFSSVNCCYHLNTGVGYVWYGLGAMVAGAAAGAALGVGSYLGFKRRAG